MESLADKVVTLHSREIEQRVLGSMMKGGGLIDSISRIVQAEDFSSDCHQKIFRAIAFARRLGHVVDAAIVGQFLHEQKQIDDIGGYTYLGDLVDIAGTGANAAYYATVVKDYSLRRELVFLGNEVIDKAQTGVGPVTELIESLRTGISRLEKDSVSSEVQVEFDAFELANCDQAAHMDYLPLLGHDGYVVRGWSHLVAGYPRSGKTELLVACCRDWLTMGETVLYFTEEPKEIWCSRLARAKDAWHGMKIYLGFGMA